MIQVAVASKKIFYKDLLIQFAEKYLFTFYGNEESLDDISVDYLIIDTDTVNYNVTAKLMAFKKIYLLCSESNSQFSYKENIEIILKPFCIKYLFNLIEDHIKSRLTSIQMKIGPYFYYPQQRIILLENKQYNLSEKENDLLHYVYHCKRAATKEEILINVFGCKLNVETNTFETHIYRLKKKIGISLLVCEKNGWKLREFNY